jgi:alpha,alpha-trehalase
MHRASHPRRHRRTPPVVPLAAACTLALTAGCLTRAPQVAQAPRGVPSAERGLWYDPARDLGPLFQAVQLAALFADSKTFADARPLLPPPQILQQYARMRSDPGFDLRAFVAQRFALPEPEVTEYHTDTSLSMEQHIRALWPVLTRAPPPDTAAGLSSLIPLPHPYVVPGGRFREVYYWDSYFTMLGLVASGRADLVKDMLDNFSFLVATFGHVPNGNRTYYLSRSQPPFFAAMIGLYARATDTAHALPYLAALEAEHAFWMDGAEHLAPGSAHRRVVRLRDGAVLNRYWDDRAEPRPEAYRQDYELAPGLPEDRREALYRNLRATAESGWDFSSRWMRDPADLRSLETTDLAPVDLNCLLYDAERLIAALRRFRGGSGDLEAARRFEAAASERRRALLASAYDPADGFFYDVRWRTGERVRDRPTLAAAVPLYFGLATEDQGRAVAARLERDFLRPGGFVTTLAASGQQWDAPNGWAPLEWMAVEGVRRYGRADLADTARARWLALNRRTYRASGRMMEKYDVVDVRRPAGGGEYPTQDGFGWTNGVALALAMAERAGAPPR